MDDQRIISPQKCSFDENDSDRNLRPPSLNEFTGQDDIKESLSIAIEAAKHRGDALDHCLFAGPPGLGKTTLSSIIAKEMGVNIHITSGPVLEKASDLAGLLTSRKINRMDCNTRHSKREFQDSFCIKKRCIFRHFRDTRKTCHRGRITDSIDSRHRKAVLVQHFCGTNLIAFTVPSSTPCHRASRSAAERIGGRIW